MASFLFPILTAHCLMEQSQMKSLQHLAFSNLKLGSRSREWGETKLSSDTKLGIRPFKPKRQVPPGPPPPITASGGLPARISSIGFFFTSQMTFKSEKAELKRNKARANRDLQKHKRLKEKDAGMCRPFGELGWGCWKEPTIETFESIPYKVKILHKYSS